MDSKIRPSLYAELIKHSPPKKQNTALSIYLCRYRTMNTPHRVSGWACLPPFQQVDRPPYGIACMVSTGTRLLPYAGGGGNRASATWKERQRVPSYDLFFAKLVAGNERPPRPPAPKTIKKHNVCGDDAMMTRFPQGDATTRQAAAMRDARQSSRKGRWDSGKYGFSPFTRRARSTDRTGGRTHGTNVRLCYYCYY